LQNTKAKNHEARGPGTKRKRVRVWKNKNVVEEEKERIGRAENIAEGQLLLYHRYAI